MRLTLKEGKNNKLHIMLDGNYAMTADAEFAAMYGLRDGTELSGEQLDALESAVNARRAFNKASELLARRDHSEKELLFKLRQRGFSDGAQQAIEKLKSYGCVDDCRFAESYASELQRLRHFGKRRIEQELMKKGVDRSIISETLEQMEFGTDELVELINRKYYRNLNDEKGVQKTINALIRAGYSFSQIREALKTVEEEKENKGDFDGE